MAASQRSKERRKDLDAKKDNKKLNAIQELKARREEKRNRGEKIVILILLFYDLKVNYDLYIRLLQTIIHSYLVHMVDFT